MSTSVWVGYPRSWTAGRRRPVQYVVLHYTAGSEGPSSAENGAAYDKIRSDGTSTHYFADSAGPALQEVPDGDRAHAALFHGNEIGIHIEICGTRQSRDQWLDPASFATLQMTAALTREICQRHGFELRRLSVDEVRAAYYAKGGKPTGICDHWAVTQAYPEDGGDHTDVGTDFPWDVFMQMVLEGTEGEDDMKQMLVRFTDAPEDAGGANQVWLCDGMVRRKVDQSMAWGDSVTDGMIGNNGTHADGMLGNLGNSGLVFASGAGGWAGRDAWGVDLGAIVGGGGTPVLVPHSHHSAVDVGGVIPE